MSRMLDSLLSPQQRIDAALDDYIKARDAHPYHAAKTSIKAQMAEIDAEVIESARDRAVVWMLRAKSTLEDAAPEMYGQASDQIVAIELAIQSVEAQRGNV